MKKLKINDILIALLAVLLFGATACQEEKELIILTGDLPFKVKTVYLVGNATPKNSTWDIDNIDLLEQSEEDPFIWTYHGGLYANGTFKVCFKSGSWAQPWVHPVTENGERYDYITKETITDRPIQSPRQGGDDELWWVVEEGLYTLTFNLRDFTFSSVYEGPLPADPADEIHLYLVGNATPLNPTWDIDNIDELVRSQDDKDVYSYHGQLREDGCFKLCYKKGLWGQPWYHPMVNDEPIGMEPIKDKPMQAPRQTGDDELWRCVKTGIYTLTFNTRELTWSSVYEGEVPEQPTEDPIEADMVYLIGNATTAGWDIEKAIPMIRSTDDKYVFTWEGDIVKANDYLLFSLNNKDWSQMIRPIEKNQPVGSSPINDLVFKYPNSDDNNFVVQTTGRYRFTINLRKRTFSSTFIK